jgi:hypothetical protein
MAGFGFFVQGLFKVKVYNMEMIEAFDVLFVIFILLISNTTFSLFLFFIGKMKINKYGWNFTKIKAASDLGDDVNTLSLKTVPMQEI